MTKGKQQTFGKQTVEKNKRGSCMCGNTSYLSIVVRKDSYGHKKKKFYCKQCARDTWVRMVEENQQEVSSYE